MLKLKKTETKRTVTKRQHNQIMKNLIKNLTICAVLGTTVSLNAQTLTVDPTQTWLGFMNVFNLPPTAVAPGDGSYQFGSSWGTGDLTASFSGSTLTLGPNEIGDPNVYWYQGGGGPGAPGNKIMDANMYVEKTGVYVNTTLTFTGTVLSDTLAGEIDPLNNTTWTSVAFIKDFVANYSSSTSSTVALTPGTFSISLPTGGATDHIQYGFE